MRFKSHLISALLLFAIAIPASAQRPPQPPRAPRAPMQAGQPKAHGVEAALRLKTELKLNDAQVAQLEALRKEIVAQRQANATKMIETQSRIEAGLLKREDVRKDMEAQRESIRKVAQERHDRFEKILTDEQRTLLREKIQHQMMNRRMHMRGNRMDRRGFRQ